MAEGAPTARAPCYPLSELEEQRLSQLHSFEVLGSDENLSFDRVTELACAFFDVPIALVSLVDTNKQWFLSHAGLPVRETHRDLAFCNWPVSSPAEGVFVVRDTLADPRFRNNGLVTGFPHIRFYAGAPLIASPGLAIGTLCVIDTKSNRSMEAEAAMQKLTYLADMVMDLLRKRQDSLAMERRLQRQMLISLSHNLRNPLHVLRFEMAEAPNAARKGEQKCPTQPRAQGRLEQGDREAGVAYQPQPQPQPQAQNQLQGMGVGMAKDRDRGSGQGQGQGQGQDQGQGQARISMAMDELEAGIAELTMDTQDSVMEAPPCVLRVQPGNILRDVVAFMQPLRPEVAFDIEYLADDESARRILLDRPTFRQLVENFCNICVRGLITAGMLATHVHGASTANPSAGAGIPSLREDAAAAAIAAATPSDPRTSNGNSGSKRPRVKLCLCLTGPSTAPVLQLSCSSSAGAGSAPPVGIGKDMELFYACPYLVMCGKLARKLGATLEYPPVVATHAQLHRLSGGGGDCGGGCDGGGGGAQSHERTLREEVEMEAGKEKEEDGKDEDLPFWLRLSLPWAPLDVDEGVAKVTPLAVPAVAGAAEAQVARLKADREGRRRSMRVLYVEDEDVNRAIMRKFLGRLGLAEANVTVHCDGDEVDLDAVEAQGLPDIVLLDIVMRRVHGDVLCAAMRRRGWSMPIVAATANGGDQSALLCAGFSRVLGKPFSPVDLARCLDELTAPVRSFLDPAAAPEPPAAPSSPSSSLLSSQGSPHGAKRMRN